MMASRVIILDRDGVINHDSPDYIKSPEEWKPIEGSLEAIARLHHAGFLIIVATNQAGVGRGLFSLDTLHQIHDKMQRMVKDSGGALAGIFYCPHHPDEHCPCRKPATGLFDTIAETFSIDLTHVPYVGDSLKDTQAAMAIKGQPILVKTGNGNRTLHALQHNTAHKDILKHLKVFNDLADYADQRLS